MSDRPNKPPGRCSACGRQFEPADLKQASIPRWQAFYEATDFQPDDRESLLPLYLDRNAYCPACRRSIPPRRLWQIVAVTLFFLASAALGHQLVLWLLK
jgi:hypothetical protein